jgi:predicted MFS family arabinose efflux permease
MGIGVQSTFKRISIILGPILGGALIDHYGLMRGVKIGVVLAILLAAVAIVFQLQIREQLRQEQKGGPLSFFKSAREFDPALRRLLLSDILVRFCERIPYAWVVIYCMNHLGINATQFGVLTGIEMATAVAFSIPLAHLSDKYGREPFILATLRVLYALPYFLAFRT